MTKTYSDILREREAVLGTFEALFKARGMGDLHGRVFGAILLSVNEMTQDDIGLFTGYSVPAVSSALDELVRVGLVNRHKRQDSRKYYYSSKADLDEIMRMVLKTLHDDYVQVVLDQLSAAKAEAGSDDDPQVKEHLENLRNYERELKNLEHYMKRLLEVPLEEQE
ncbi:GbsR/MarR family transcriptional regulator [Methanocella sp. MCL-LM]|uniref:GbsR/MarR family transcriptional regulator n=1 Tax=Methanocella sp. MCL-LM TaxID=3412035 RepID=UPI003C781CDA